MTVPQARVLTKDNLVEGLRKVGLQAGHHVVVHSSLSRFGRVMNGAHDVIDALEEVVTPNGTLVMPTFTSRLLFFLEALHARSAPKSLPAFEGTSAMFWAAVRSVWEEHNFKLIPFATPAALWKRVNDEAVFRWKGWLVEPNRPDIAEDTIIRIVKDGPPLPPEELKPWRIPTDSGLIPETFWRRPEVRRSEHYSGSFAAWGALTDRILEGHDNHSTKVFEDHPLYRMKEIEGKILLLGINHGNNSTIHVAEQAAIRERGLKDYPEEYLGHFMAVEEPLNRAGGQNIGMIGNAEVRLADTRTLYRVVGEILDEKLNAEPKKA